MLKLNNFIKTSQPTNLSYIYPKENTSPISENIYVKILFFFPHVPVGKVNFIVVIGKPMKETTAHKT